VVHDVQPLAVVRVKLLADSRSRESCGPPGQLRGRLTWLPGLTGYLRLTIRHERYANLFAAFVALGATITAFKTL
jgi:hypothetical protein